jgi:hypothetical protein
MHLPTDAYDYYMITHHLNFLTILIEINKISIRCTIEFDSKSDQSGNIQLLVTLSVTRNIKWQLNVQKNLIHYFALNKSEYGHLSKRHLTEYSKFSAS